VRPIDFYGYEIFWLLDCVDTKIEDSLKQVGLTDEPYDDYANYVKSLIIWWFELLSDITIDLLIKTWWL
jgi:hypothetical protein